MTLNEFLSEWDSASPTLVVHTSGSTGKPKPMTVEKRRMAPPTALKFAAH